VISDSNEAEAFLEELANSISAEQEDAEDDLVLMARVDQLLSGLVQLLRGVHVWESVLLVLRKDEVSKSGTHAKTSTVLPSPWTCTDHSGQGRGYQHP